MKLRSHVIWSLSVLLIFGSTDLFSQRRKPARKGTVTAKATVFTPAQSTPEALRRRETFLKVWSTLAENYFDPTFNKLDWNKIKAEYEPRARAAKTDKALHDLLGEMISRLGRSHLMLIPPEIYYAIETAKVEAKARESLRAAREAEDDDAEDEEPADLPDLDDPLTQYGIGIDMRIIDGRFTVSRVDAGSSAESFGLKPGYIIERVSGVSLTELLARIAREPNSERVRRYLPFEIITSMINGPPESTVSLAYIDGSGTPKEALIEREKLKSKVISLMSSMPERHLNFEKRVLPGDIGYIHFDYFALSVLDSFCDAIGEFRGKKGLVIDLRGNFGGLLATMPVLAGMLSTDEIDLGTSIYRTSAEKLRSTPKPRNFTGNVVFLVDAQSVSAAELFAASMQDAGRAFVVGERTAGEALPSLLVELPTRAVLQYPIANYRTGGGRFLEGQGVEPDFPVSLSRAALLQGRDEQLEKAVELIQADKRPAKKADTSEMLSGSGDVGTPPPPVPPPPGRRPVPRTSDSAAAPPPAPPRPVGDSQVFTIRGDANVPADPGSRVVEPAAAKVIDGFLEKIGGADKVRQIERYELRGETELTIKGTRNALRINIFRDGPSRYSEILSSASAGEIREMHNGKTITVQTDYGLTREIPKFVDVVETDILAPITALARPDFFVALKYQGVFDREGKKVHLLDGRTKDGMMVALAFDSSSGLLLNFTGAYYGISLGDYRKQGDLLLPHVIERERIMTIELDEIKINQPIDQSQFVKKEKCFDRAN